MEEDNAHDIYKYIQSKEIVDNHENKTVSVLFRTKTFQAKLRLHGNILCVTASGTDVHEPLIFVLERLHVRRKNTDSFCLVVSFAEPNDTMELTFESEQQMDNWMVKIATCSHQMSRAGLDELAYKFYTMSTNEESCPDSPSPSFHNYYLVNPHRYTHQFAISQQNSLPSRRITVDETMWESKLSLLLPIEMVKLYRKWITDFGCLLESRQRCWPSESISKLHEVLREIRENTETYEQCFEFINTYTGPSYRKSTEKHRVAFGPVPTNLHVQVCGLSKQTSKEVLTCGSTSAIPLRFTHGGLSRLCGSLEVDPAYHEQNFWNKRHQMMALKRNIGELSHKLEGEWKIANFGKPDKVCLEMCAGIKQISEGLRDVMQRLNGIAEMADMLMEDERRRISNGQKVEIRVPDGLQNQMDTIDAMMISLNTKMAVIDTLNDEQTERYSYEKSAREAMSSCLDLLLSLADSLLESQLLGLVMALGKPSAARAFFHIQLRSDFVLSQATTIGATAILSRIHCGWPTGDTSPDLLLTTISFLSAYGDERGMAEDAWDAWKMLESRVEFSLVRAPSAVCRNCIPMLTGNRTGIKVSIPIPHETYDALPLELRNKQTIRIRTAFFNIGVNHEATLGQSFGGVAFETAINQEAAERMNAYANYVNCPPNARDVVYQLVNTVAAEPSRKNLQIFEQAVAACDALQGRTVICCKSGKDRTGMAVTLEQGWTLQQTCGLNTSQVTEMVASLRRDGVRRENCRKNVGKNMYSFSPFQLHFLPKCFRPPNGTYAQGVAS